MEEKKNVALIAGGTSGEYEISINSAKALMRHLDSSLYNIFLIVVDKNSWHYEDKEGARYPIDKNDFSIILNQNKITFDVAFIIIHGTPGEDGMLQGYFDMLHIPYTTCDLFTSSITFNKHFSKYVANGSGIATAKAIRLTKHSTIPTSAEMETIGFPCFVKPNKGGSSVGISKVYHIQELEKAIALAFAEDDEVLIEETIVGREFSCGVYRIQNKLQALPITEILSQNDFFDYEAKYQGCSEEITPADLSPELTAMCQQISEKLYNVFNCKGIVRFDYILYNNRFYFLEVNTIPGLSDASIIPQQLKQMGIALPFIYNALIKEALD